jgi:carbonic anhydrase
MVGLNIPGLGANANKEPLKVIKYAGFTNLHAVLRSCFVAVILLALAACERSAENLGDAPSDDAANHEDEVTLHWGYAGEIGPEYWGGLSEDYAACAIGATQSPIDLTQPGLASDTELSVDYASGPLEIFNDGHTVQINFAPGSTMNNGEKDYALLQLHFHTPSEHTVDQMGFPLEVHFVHRADDGGLGVIGILFEEGVHNDALNPVLATLPQAVSEPRKIDGVAFNPSDLLPEDLAAYRYSGSLTTPPCSEGVAWHVALNVQQASREQLSALRAVLGDNARSVQPINHRQITAPN